MTMQTATGAKPERAIPLNLIDPSPFNPRKTFEGIDELTASFKEHGQLQAINVRPMKGGRFEVMGGERRRRAAKAAGWTEIRAVEREASDDEAHALQLVENLQREDISPLEEAAGFAELQDKNPKVWTNEAIARSVSKTPRFVQQRLAIHRGLAPALKKEFGEGRLNVEQARTLAMVPAKMQTEIANQPWNMGSADRIREQIAARAIPANLAIFPIEKYKGEKIEVKGKVDLLADVDQFMTLQRAVLQSRAEKLKADWPKVVLIGDPAKLYDWAWADNGQRVARTRDRKKSGDSKIPKEKQAALVWLDSRGEYGQALGVVPATSIKEQRSSEPSGPPRESAEQKRRRTAFVAETTKAAAADRLIGLRIVLVAFLGNRCKIGYDGSAVRKIIKALPEPLRKLAATGYGDTRDAARWAAVAKMTSPQILTALAPFAATAVTWTSHEKNPPALTAAIAKELGVKLPPPAPKKKAKPKARPKAKAKVKRKAKK